MPGGTLIFNFFIAKIVFIAVGWKQKVPKRSAGVWYSLVMLKKSGQKTGFLYKKYYFFDIFFFTLN